MIQVVFNYFLNFLSVDVVDLFPVLVGHHVLLDLHGRAQLSPRQREVAGNEGPLLDPLGVADRPAVDLVQPGLYAGHDGPGPARQGRPPPSRPRCRHSGTSPGQPRSGSGSAPSSPGSRPPSASGNRRGTAGGRPGSEPG